MITTPIDVRHSYEIRKSKKQKTAFLTAVTAYCESLRYPVRIEKGSMGSRNLVIGEPAKANYLITAHYDTPASIGLPNFLTPCNPVIFILFQLLLLIPFFAAAFIASMLVGLVTDNSLLIFWAAYIAYFGTLFLLMFGPANRHNANDNTSGVVALLEIAQSMPENLRDRVAFVLFDLEEAGLIGSASYRKLHKLETDRQIVLNLDCVGDGDYIVLFPNKRLKTDRSQMERLRFLSGNAGKKIIRIHERGFAYCPSDHRHFPLGVGIMAFRKAKFLGLYCGRIHTCRDTILEHTNVNILRAAIISLIGAAEK